MNLERAVIIAKNKNTGDILEFLYTVERDILLSRMAVITSVAESQDPEEVKRDYGPNNRGNLPWQCNYCPFVKLCWREFEPEEKKGRKWHVDYKLFQAWTAMHTEVQPNDQETTTPTV